MATPIHIKTKTCIVLWVMVCCVFLNSKAQQTSKINLFASQDVSLLPGIFKDAQQTDLDYILKLNPDRLLAPYLREAGVKPKALNYPSWENTGLDGHIGGHYLSALSMMFAATGDQRIKEKLTYVLDQLKICQDRNGDGYIGGVPGSKLLWADVARGNIQAGTFDLNKKWVPLYNIHKIFAGLKDAYIYTHDMQAKIMLIKFSDWFVWLTKNLSEDQIQDMLRSEHGGINEVLADVYEITGDKKYLTLAYKFSHHRILDPLEKHLDSLNGLHANTQIPKVIGFKRIADLNNDTLYNSAASFFLETVLKNRTIANGGNSVREHFNPSNDFSSMISSVEGPETCNSYNMLKLAKEFYASDGLTRYIDYYERTLYNHILSSQHPKTGGFVYFTPMRPGHYRVYSQPETSFWCCVGSGLENHAKYNELIFAYAKDNFYVNLFIPSKVNWKAKGITIIQNTSFPESDLSTVTIAAGPKTAFTMNIRYPNWVRKGTLAIDINGLKQLVKTEPGNYIRLNRIWNKGDVIKLSLPIHNTIEQLPDGSPYFAVLHGPILLAAKTSTADLQGLLADSSRMAHIAAGKQYPLQTMPMFVTNEAKLTRNLKRVNGKSLFYTAQKLIYPQKYQNLELMPFYKIHDARYIIYWRTESRKAAEVFQKELKEKERAAEELAKATLDYVTPGEQQPESDHCFQGNLTNSGILNDQHWRSTKGWFSYQLKYGQVAKCSIRLTYFGLNKDKHFKIIVNNNLIEKVSLTNKEQENFYTVDYQIPEEVIKIAKGTLTIKFEASKDSETPKLFEIRLLRSGVL